jgi:YHS domain-containing protein
MLRFLILIVVGYLAYRAVKNWMDAGRTPVGPSAEGELADVMIQDPYCRAYFPKRDAVHLQLDGQDLYFCSQTCKQNFITEQTADKE